MASRRRVVVVCVCIYACVPMWTCVWTRVDMHRCVCHGLQRFLSVGGDPSTRKCNLALSGVESLLSASALFSFWMDQIALGKGLSTHVYSH